MEMVMFFTIDGMAAVVANRDLRVMSAAPIFKVTLVSLPDLPPPEQAVIQSMRIAARLILKNADFIVSSIC